MLLPGIDDDVLLSPVDWAVSIYLPLDPATTDERAHLDRLEALFKQCDEALRDRGADKRTRARILGPGREAAAQLDFREHRPPAIAMFMSRDFARAFELPHPVHEEATVGHRFVVRPLVPLINGGAFFVLALNQTRGRLLECYDGGWVDRTPEALRHPPDVARQTDYQPTAAGNPVAPHRRPSANVVGSHSYEMPDEVRKAEILETLQRISSALEATLKDDQRPVILIADTSIAGHFRKLTHVHQLAAEGVSVNPNGLGNDKLVKMARALYHPPQDSERSEVLDRVNARAQSGEGPVAVRLDDVVSAAHYGRVDAAIVSVDDRVWGHFDDATGTVAVHERAERDDDELINEAVAETLLKGGRVYHQDRRALPRRSYAIALLRY